jgi:hypothetical protein
MAMTGLPEYTNDSTNDPSDLRTFIYESGLGVFESQRKYAYKSPELSTSPRKLDTALRSSTIDSYFNRRGTPEETTDDKLFTLIHEEEELEFSRRDPTFYPRFLKHISQNLNLTLT